ncbi:MAG TPA: hypothetical protein VHX64_07675 [Caulobacteraceae bacterium]|nr:hypothetical protein [Caulobacteraceae bacterium]
MIGDKAPATASSFAVMAAALILALAVCGPASAFSFGKKKEAPPPAPAPPPVEAEIPVGPPVLADYVVRQAGAYATFMRHASAISSSFPDGASVSSALRVGAHSEQHQLQQGVVAYAALVALQDPTFVNAVRSFAHHASTRDQIIGYILADPGYVLSLGGHDSAAGLIVSTLDRQAAQLTAVGDKVKQASLDIQLKASWSKRPVPNPDQRLMDVKQLSAGPLTADDDVRSELQEAETAPEPITEAGPPVAPPYNQAVIRGMALAALAILGRAGDANMDYVMPLLVNDNDGYCFSMSKLNLYQCLAVARPYYEDMYCLGLHALDDTGGCVASEVGHPLPEAPTAPEVAIATPASATTTVTESAADPPSERR